MAKADITLEITFNPDKTDKTIIKTNANKEGLREVLEAWLSCEAGQGEDDSEPNEKSEYKITIQIDLDSDTFYTDSDTGNKGLTCGIVMEVLNKLDKITITDLS